MKLQHAPVLRSLALLLFLFTAYSTFGQTPIPEKMRWYGMANPSSTLFVHFDKNIYSNNETIYFTGYLVKSESTPINSHNILSVNLVREIDTTLILTEKFAMKNGLSLGSINLPDSIQTGNYRLVAHTDRMLNGKPEVAFIQQILIKTNIDPAFKANIKITELANDVNKTHKLLFSATTNDNRFLTKPINITYKYGDVIKKAKTDASGQVVMSLPQQNQIADPNVYVKLTSDKDTSYISMALPLAKNKASVMFYPEGGYRVDGLINTIGWEVKDQQKKPVALKALLYKNNQIIDTIETGSYGIGRFNIFNEPNANYTVKLVHDGFTDTTYTLPKAIQNSLALNIAKAVTTDTLAIGLRANGTKNLMIYIHNFKETFVAVPFTLNLAYRKIRIPLTEVPKGLATITITDSLNRPLAERIFFAHYDNKEKITINSDKQIYEPRAEITLSLGLNEAIKESLVSIAVVQENRIDQRKYNDIESYTYLTNELSTLPLNVKGLPIKDTDYLEQILLVKGWRRYSWQGLMAVAEADTIKNSTHLTMTGEVLRKGKTLKEPITLAVFGGDGLNVKKTSETGFFDFDTPELFTNGNKRTYLYPVSNNKFDFQIKINDQFVKLGQEIKQLNMENGVLPSTLANNAELLIKGNEKAIRLREVVIKKTSTAASFQFSNKGPYGPNPCGDYVCKFNIFNCPNHTGDPENTQPIAGRSYTGHVGPYQECKVFSSTDLEYTKFNGFHHPKEFYLDDHKDPAEPAFFSTIYWNYGMLLKTGQANTIKFHAGDIAGKFKVIIQGITKDDVVYADHTFEVKKIN